MKTLEQTLNKWYNPLHGISNMALIQITEAMKEYATEYAKIVQSNIAYSVREIDKSTELASIVLSEDNLPKHR